MSRQSIPRIEKNAPADSEISFGDDLPKRIMNVTTNKKLFSTSKTSFQSCNPSFKSSKNSRRFPQNPENRNRNGYQNRNNTAATTATNIPNKKKH